MKVSFILKLFSLSLLLLVLQPGCSCNSNDKEIEDFWDLYLLAIEKNDSELFASMHEFPTKCVGCSSKSLSRDSLKRDFDRWCKKKGIAEHMKEGKIYFGTVEEMLYKKKMFKILKDIGEMPKKVGREEIDNLIKRDERVIGFTKEDFLILFWHEKTGDEASFFLRKYEGKFKIYHMAL